MSMISELVNRLRAESKSMGKYGNDYMATLLMRSADTIVMLSEKARTDTPQTDEKDEYAEEHEAFGLRMRKELRICVRGEPETEISRNSLRKGCNGCKFVGSYDTEFPCSNCIRKSKDYYIAEHTDCAWK